MKARGTYFFLCITFHVHRQISKDFFRKPDGNVFSTANDRMQLTRSVYQYVNTQSPRLLKNEPLQGESLLFSFHTYFTTSVIFTGSALPDYQSMPGKF